MDVFDDLSSVWWDDQGPMKVLHHINPVRMAFINSIISLQGKLVLDIGCGGGILSESLVRSGAEVIGVDRSSSLIDVAKLHAASELLAIDYKHATVDDLLETHKDSFDCIVCMEVIEHVSSPRVFIGQCIKLLKEGGYIILSTINRTAKSYFLTIVIAEYILSIITRGTHDWSCFIKPSELSVWLEEYGLLVRNVKGLHYNPMTHSASLSSSVDVNYFMVAQK
ncbi:MULTISPECIES: bifunctional 2-polyprenyl-6-hydroxyphenol methylase/3-demethylubiquinol 3-O-methyltransferase UbiG [Candidatus Ichthyocystis]|uniref:Ubiquinone biosynthesis O-methyltransferase n=1 Tax=Candidatus Ichthyocystis hellenicum TaxID=1561003 RepID=A0A0S4M3E0_9BURK|nr:MULTISPECIES: bifunctional 2-polyprenyl-6-hydroxyphenol methylase/3-demethylubiquinol 3-O-methyltransferase UbiG [Ichthyocystis]CUT18206.1 3-demethylubiquinone-9 3-methyltransferase [Candidatus Ichthyocystis hellenicum]